MLYDFIITNRNEIVAHARAKAVARSQCRPAGAEADEGIPLFLAELSQALQHAPVRGMDVSAAQHGSDLQRMGFSVSQLVHGYGDVCQAVTELALEHEMPITTDDFRIFIRCLDEAIAGAVTEYGRQREEGIARKSTERLGMLAHELRNSLSNALLAFATLRRNVVVPETGTAAVLGRSLQRLSTLIDRSLSEVRVESGLVRKAQFQQVSICDLVQEVAVSAAAHASQRGVGFRVGPVPSRLMVKADRTLLLGALENVVQNALKFTPRGGHVFLAIKSLDGRVRLEVEDECGGLPEGKACALFGAFTQQGSDRTGLGLGLWISRSSLATFGGTIAVRDVPGKGCVFSLEVPMSDAAEGAFSPHIQSAQWGLGAEL